MHNNNTDLDSLTTARKGPHGEATNDSHCTITEGSYACILCVMCEEGEIFILC